MAKAKTTTISRKKVLEKFPLERPDVPDGPGYLKPVKFNSDHIRKLAFMAHYYDLDFTNPVRGEKNRLFPSQRKFKELLEKYEGNEEKAYQRFEEFAQSYAGLARAFLSAMIEMGLDPSDFVDDTPAPKPAKKAKKKKK